VLSIRLVGATYVVKTTIDPPGAVFRGTAHRVRIDGGEVEVESSVPWVLEAQ
jgi:hypothetical protein